MNFNEGKAKPKTKYLKEKFTDVHVENMHISTKHPYLENKPNCKIYGNIGSINKYNGWYIDPQALDIFLESSLDGTF